MIHILFFAKLREQLDTQGLSCEHSQGATVGALKAELIARGGDDWRDALGAENVLSAVNQSLVKDDAIVADGDEVAFFPPVTGG